MSLVASFADGVVVLLLLLVGCIFFLAELSSPDDASWSILSFVVLLLWRKRDDDEAKAEKGSAKPIKPRQKKEMIIRKNKKEGRTDITLLLSNSVA